MPPQRFPKPREVSYEEKLIFDDITKKAKRRDSLKEQLDYALVRRTKKKNHDIKKQLRQ